MTESQLTRDLCRVLEAQGAMCIALVGHEMQMAGLPDRLIIHRRGHFWLEAKSRHGSLRPLQAVIIGRLRSRGEVVVVGRYVADKVVEIDGVRLAFNEVLDAVLNNR